MTHSCVTSSPRNQGDGGGGRGRGIGGGSRGVSDPCVAWVVLIGLTGKEASVLVTTNYFYPSEITQPSLAQLSALSK